MNHNYEFIRVDRANGLATLWLNCPPLNILNIAMLEELIGALKEIGLDEQTRLLLIRGDGVCFSAGVDIADHLPDRVHEMLRNMRQLLGALADLKIPTISLIHGSALGGGLEFAAIADFVYAAADCKIGTPEIKLGVFPPFAIAYFPELVGRRNTIDMVLSGRTISPEEAVRIGLINGVFSSHELESRIQEISESFLGLSKAALASAKKSLDLPTLFARLQAVEEIYLEELMQTEDAIEGLKAFLEKRIPQWKHQ